MTRPEELPVAVARRPRAARWAWLVPVVVLVIAAWIGWRTWAETGTHVVVRFAEGHGLAPGSEVRYRGIGVGVVRRVELTPDGDAVRVRLDLGPSGERFAREGARFWIVRPQIDLESGVRGAETLLGSRYVAALPGTGDEIHTFAGLPEPLLVPELRPGDLEIVLEASARGNLDAGTLLTYRDVKVGVIVEVRLAPDARAVEARAHVPAEFAPLMRRGTEFHFAGGVDAEWGTRFLFMEFGGQLARILSGGAVALAVPPDPGPCVESGHRFVVHEAAKEEWAEWRPSIPLGLFDAAPAAGSSGAAGESPSLIPVEARLAWKAGFFGGRKEVIGWVLPVTGGLLGPLEVLRAPSDADAGSVTFEVAGEPIGLPLPPRVCGDGIGLLDVPYPGARVAPALRESTESVDCLALRGAGEPALAIPARQLRATPTGFDVDEAVEIEGTWNGAVVVTRVDREFVGILVCDKHLAQVVRPEISVGSTPLSETGDFSPNR